MRNSLPVLVLAFCLLSPMQAQNAPATADLEGRPITAIEYSPADQPLTPADLTAAQTLKLGQPLHKADVSAAIDHLFATGRYDDIQVETTASNNGVTVRFVTKNKTFVGHVGVTGKVSSPPNRGQLVDAAQLNLGQPFDMKNVDAGNAAIIDTLHRNGLNEGMSEHRQEPKMAQQMDVIYDVDAGKRAHFEEPVLKGNLKLTPQQIVKATHWRKFLIHTWRQVTEADVRRGIEGVQRAYQKKGRLMAKVQLTAMDYNADKRTERPTLQIDAGPKVTVTTVETKISKGKLQRYIPIYDERSVDNDLLVEGARNLRDYLQASGYYKADVTFREHNDPAKDELTIEYVIARGDRHKLVRVAIAGNKYFRESALRERIFLHQANFLQFRHGRYSEVYRTADEQAISNLYKSNGFRDVKVTSTIDENFKGKKGDVAVTYHVNEGPQWFVDDLQIKGVNASGAKQVEASLSSTDGQPFSDFNVASDRKALLDYYYSNGYPAARFEWKYTPSDQTDHVKVVYDVTEGDEQFVRDVLISGIKQTRMKLIDKNMRVKKGDPLAPMRITDSQHNLYNLGVFAKVDEAIQNADGTERNKYVLYDIEEASRYTLNLGIGAEFGRFGPTTSTVSLSEPNGANGFSPDFLVDLSRINVLGLGNTASFQGRLSTLEQRGQINYYLPRFQNVEGRNITFSLLYDNSRDVLTFSSQREEASVQMSQKFTKALNGLFRFSYRRVTTSNIVIPTLLVPQLLQPVRIGILSASLVQDRRDSPTDARRGVYNTLDVGLASGVFGSQRSFARFLGQNATYTQLPNKWVLARELTFGAIIPFHITDGLTAANYIPLPERFFAGGAESLRAFAFDQAGPRDIGTPAGPGAPATQATGFPLGGDAIFIHKTELRFPLIGDNIGGVFFHDMGNVYSTLNNISFRFTQKNDQDFDYMVHSVGFGIRYKTPVGPIRIDLAYVLNPPNYVGFNGTYQQLLTCNPNAAPGTLPSYCTPVRQNTGHFQYFFSIGQTF